MSKSENPEEKPPATAETERERQNRVASQVGSIHLAQILIFRERYQMPTPAYPVLLPRVRAEHHLKLIFEELQKELREAVELNDLVGVADAIADGQVVLDHMACEYGLWGILREIEDEVDVSNNSKSEEGELHFDAKGKFLKGRRYRRPDLRPILWRALGLPDSPENRWAEPTFRAMTGIRPLSINGDCFEITTLETARLYLPEYADSVDFSVDRVFAVKSRVLLSVDETPPLDFYVLHPDSAAPVCVNEKSPLPSAAHLFSMSLS